jgi:hypothetical protein
VEGVHQVLVLGVIERLFDVDIDLHKLVVVSGEDDLVIGGRQSHALNARSHDSCGKLVVLTLVFLLTLRQLSNLHVRVFWVL